MEKEKEKKKRGGKGGLVGEEMKAAEEKVE